MTAREKSKVAFEQYRIIPSGCLQCSSVVVGIDRTETYFAFCSTLAIYVYELKGFRLCRILSGSLQQNIAAFTWSPHVSTNIATSGTKLKLLVWNLETEQIVSENDLPGFSPPTVMEWNPHQDRKNEIAIACEDAM